MNFTEFWPAYPAQSKHKGSKQKAERLFNRLNMYERHSVMLSLPVYQDHLNENGWKNPMMAATYLGRDRHWESFQPVKAVEAQIEEIEASREHQRRLTEYRQAQADEQWKDRFEKQFGRRP